MANFTELPEDEYDVFMGSPEDEYDVFIEGGLEEETEQCDKHSAEVLSAQQLLQFCSTMFAIGLLGNVLVVFILVKYKRLKHARSTYFLNLALSNLCLLLPLPFWAHASPQGESLGHPTCKILGVLHSLGLHSEALLSVLLLVQRHKAFCHVRWLSSALHTAPGGVATSVLVWVVAILVMLPEFLFYKSQLEGQHYTSSFSRHYFLAAEGTFWKPFLTLKMNMLGLVFPLCVFLFCFVRRRKPSRFEETQRGLCQLVFAIPAVFLLMWGPYQVALFLSAFQEHLSLSDCKSSYKLDIGIQVTKIIATTHCCVNPFLCLLLDGAFRKYCCVPFSRRKDTLIQSYEDSARSPLRQEHDQSTTL